MKPPELSEKDMSRFWSKVARTLPNDCWVWRGGRHANGYGQFGYGPFGGVRMLGAHRVALFLATGAWPPVVMHKCDNCPCCNPAHLHAASGAAENIADAVAKGRMASGERHWTWRMPERCPKGARNPMAKVTEKIVRAIRDAHARGSMTQRDLAKWYGLHQNYVNLIVKRRRWKHV
jgi:hypothetical protein